MGVSTLEALAALAITILLLSFAYPMVAGGTTPSRLLALVGASASLLRDARTTAMASGKPVVARFDAGRYPTTQEGLGALNTRPTEVASWGGPYVKGTAVPKDPWNHPYNYKAPGGNGRPYDITSDGPGGKGGETDGAHQIASY